MLVSSFMSRGGEWDTRKSRSSSELIDTAQNCPESERGSSPAQGKLIWWMGVVVEAPSRLMHYIDDVDERNTTPPSMFYVNAVIGFCFLLLIDSDHGRNVLRGKGERGG